MPLPEDVALTLLRSIGAYLRATSAPELPASVRRYKGFRDSALAKHRELILAMLDDETQRALIVQWLDDDKVPLGKPEIETLRIAASREDGWEEALTARSKQPAPKPTAASTGTGATAGIEREKDKTRRAKEELRRHRQEAEAALRAERVRAESVTKEVGGLQAQIESLVRELDVERGLRETESARTDRDVRRARSEAEKAQSKLVEQNDELKVLRRELAAARERIAELERPPPKRKPKVSAPQADAARGPRLPLTAPKGRFEDDPETLETWLATPMAMLLIDGYNVTKAEGGFGELELEGQRDRLIKEVNRLARRGSTTGRIVFDGNEVPPGTTRATRGPVKVVYSRPDEIADDAIIDILEDLPPVPVILVTNDRELQDRGRALGATIATSNQLLKLLH